MLDEEATRLAKSTIVNILSNQQTSNNDIGIDYAEDDVFIPEKQEFDENATVEERYLGRVAFDKDEYSKIHTTISKDVLKFIYFIALSGESNNNNKKVNLISHALGDKFIELGTGTNRTVFLHGKYVYKIALDRRGLLDNVSEFKRSKEFPHYAARSFETNALITVQEYVTGLEVEEFLENRETIIALLSELGKNYIFFDVGFDTKNYCNWGYRDKLNGEKTLVILDYAYTYPKIGNEDILHCTGCGKLIDYNTTFTAFHCPKCGLDYTYADISRSINSKYDELEQEYSGMLQDLELPDMEDIVF